MVYTWRLSHCQPWRKNWKRKGAQILKGKPYKHFQTGHHGSGLLALIHSRFLALNKEIFVECKPDPVISPISLLGILEQEWETLLHCFLSLYRQMTVTTPLRERHIVQTAATTLSSHRLCLTLNILASLAFILQFVYCNIKIVFITTYNYNTRRKTLIPTIISSTTWPICAFFLGTPYCSFIYKIGLCSNLSQLAGHIKLFWTQPLTHQAPVLPLQLTK